MDSSQSPFDGLDEDTLERIKEEDKKVIYQPQSGHAHNWVRDPDEETDTYYGMICTSCPLVSLVRKK